MSRVTDRRSAGRPGGGEQGFTLVEVLAAGVILSVVALCLVRSWAVFDRVSIDLVLRQKAALVLNGEVERLWTVYTGTNYGASYTATQTYAAVPGLPNSAARLSYPAGAVPFTTSSAAAFNPDPSSAAAYQTSGPLVFLGAGSPPQNWVWLDQPRGLVARLSWRLCPVANPDLRSCWGLAPTGKVGKAKGTAFQCLGFSGSGTAACQMLTAVLEYPYRFNGGAPQALGPTRMLTLSTVVGRRS